MLSLDLALDLITLPWVSVSHPSTENNYKLTSSGAEFHIS